MIFNAEMVRAILDGRKTQTRRPIKWKQTRCTEIGERDDGSYWPWSEDCENCCDYWHPCPFGAVGDRIWVRETFGDCGERLVYRADTDDGAQCKVNRWTPSIHMPRWASRITLEITGVRVERLNDISQKDVIAEGGPPSHPSIDAVSQQFGYPDFSRSWFGQTWQHIYGEESWQANPWVWVIAFQRVEGGAA
ncbi:hypothetical protein PO474_21635 [Phytobacter diazotrophicus]